MTQPPDFEDRLAGRLEQTAATVAGDAPHLAGVLAHHARVAARRRHRQRAAAGTGLVLLLAVGGTWALRDEPTRLETSDPSTTTSETTTSTTATSTSTTTTSTTEATTTTATPPPPEWPEPRLNLIHGGEAWGVYLAVAAEYDAPAIVDAAAQVEGLGVGYRAGSGTLGCDQGAAEALGLDPEAQLYTAALYFWSEADAQRFVDLFEPDVPGIALVKTYCLD